MNRNNILSKYSQDIRKEKAFICNTSEWLIARAMRNAFVTSMRQRIPPLSGMPLFHLRDAAFITLTLAACWPEDDTWGFVVTPICPAMDA